VRRGDVAGVDVQALDRRLRKIAAEREYLLPGRAAEREQIERLSLLKVVVDCIGTL
jgi:hypothetical protein